MAYTGKLQAHIAVHKLLDHASDVVLEVPWPEDVEEEPATSGGPAAAGPSAAVGGSPPYGNEEVV